MRLPRLSLRHDNTFNGHWSFFLFGENIIQWNKLVIHCYHPILPDSSPFQCKLPADSMRWRIYDLAKVVLLLTNTTQLLATIYISNKELFPLVIFLFTMEAINAAFWGHCKVMFNREKIFSTVRIIFSTVFIKIWWDVGMARTNIKSDKHRKLHLIQNGTIHYQRRKKMIFNSVTLCWLGNYIKLN